MRRATSRASRPPTTPAHATPGQVLIIFAAAAVVLVGMLGLATDLGYSYAERRTMQNAADAGAMAGARIITKATSSHPLSAWGDVQTMVDQNKMGSTNPTITECVYVSDPDGNGNETNLGDCTGTVPKTSGPTATGVRVTVQETHDTFFIGVVPGGPQTSSTGATATAHAMVPTTPSDGPFLVCANGTTVVDDSGHKTGSMDILVVQSGQWVLNPTLVTMIRNGQSPWFQVHGPQINTCNAQSSRFKGLADDAANSNKTTPAWFTYTTGDVASIQTTVDGIQGCKAGQTINNCVAILPIAVNNPPETNNSKQLYTVALAPFYIRQDPQNPSNAHDGQLLLDYVIYGSGRTAQYGWYQGYIGPIVIRMTK